MNVIRSPRQVNGIGMTRAKVMSGPNPSRILRGCTIGPNLIGLIADFMARELMNRAWLVRLINVRHASIATGFRSATK